MFESVDEKVRREEIERGGEEVCRRWRDRSESLLDMSMGNAYKYSTGDALELSRDVDMYLKRIQIGERLLTEDRCFNRPAALKGVGQRFYLVTNTGLTNWLSNRHDYYCRLPEERHGRVRSTCRRSSSSFKTTSCQTTEKDR